MKRIFYTGAAISGVALLLFGITILVQIAVYRNFVIQL